MGAEFSRAVLSDLQKSTFNELLSDEKVFVDRLREAVRLLDYNVQSKLSELLAKNPTKDPAKRPAKNPAKKRRISKRSAQHDSLQEATVAGPNTTTSNDATALSPLSGVAALGEQNRLQQLWNFQTVITLPSKIEALFEKWKTDPLEFLNGENYTVSSSLKGHYDYTRSVERATISNKILWRFVTTAYYDVISARSSSSRYSITKEAAEFAVAAICESPSYNREDVQKHIVRWAQSGAKYRALADKLEGTSCYFYYPPSISEWIWTKHLPQDNYDEAAQLLRKYGIVEAAKISGAVELARSIETMLKAPFQKPVATSPEGHHIQTIDNARDLEPCATTLSSFQSNSSVSTPSTIQSQGIDSTTSTTESLQSRALNHINYKASEQDTRLISTARMPAASIADSSRLLRSPDPDQTEYMFRHIRMYFEKSLSNMKFDKHENLVHPGDAELQNFDSYCFTATMLGRQLNVESRSALSKASALAAKILRAEHPRTLACFLEVFIHFIQTKHFEVALVLRQFIQQMSREIFRKECLWGQICWSFGELDRDPRVFVQAMTQIWECTTHTFESQLGKCSRLAVSVRLDYIKRVCANNLEEEERLLQNLLAQLSSGELKVSTPRVMLNLAHNLNRRGYHDEAEKLAQEVSSLLEKHERYAQRMVERIECMKICFLSQYNRRETQKAEWTIRRAIEMIVDQWGTQHSWVLEFKIVLGGWLREWGREEDARTIRGEIEQLMESDQENDTAQGLL